MAARASTTQKPNTSRRYVPRGTLASCHRDSSSSPSSSGRERRRRGKDKMQQRIIALEERVTTLLEIIAQLTTNTTGSMVSSPVVFDLFSGDGDFAEVAVQTDISADWSKPDVFIHLPYDMADQRLNSGDAAAGAFLVTPNVTKHRDASFQDSKGLRDYESFSRDFNSHNLELSAESDLGGVRADIKSQCPTACANTDFNCQALANLELLTKELAVSPSSLAQPAQQSRQALDGVNAEHRAAGNPSHPASGAELVVDEPHATHPRLPGYMSISQGPQHLGSTKPRSQHSRRALDAHHAEHRDVLDNVQTSLETAPLGQVDVRAVWHNACANTDFNSQTLATDEHFTNEPTLDRPGPLGSLAHTTQHTRQALDVVHAEHRGAGVVSKCATPTCATEPELDTDEPIATLTRLPDFTSISQEPSHLGSHATLSQQSRQALEVHNAEHRAAGPIATPTRLSDFTSISQEPSHLGSHATLTQQSQQALEVHNAEHRAAGHLPRGVPSSVQASGEEDPLAQGEGRADLKSQCRPACAISDFNSQHLAISAPLNRKQAGPGPLVVSADIESHSCPASANSDFNSQNLAYYEPLNEEQAGPSYPSYHALSQQSRQALDDVLAEHRAAGGDTDVQGEGRADITSQCRPACATSDFNSQHLANSELLNKEQAGPGHLDVCADLKSQSRAACTRTDFNSQILANSEPLNEEQAGPGHLSSNTLSQQSRQALEDVHAEHRAAGNLDTLSLAADEPLKHLGHDGKNHSLIFGPSERANFQLRQKSLQSKSVGNDAKQLSADGASLGALGDLEAARAFKDAVAPIIAAYMKRRKPTNIQARAAARAIINVARQFPISKDECCAHLKEHSLVLWCVTTDLWL